MEEKTMRLTRKAALAGIASLAVAGAAWAAEKPAKPQPHVMEVALPDGGVARISYSGDVAPQISVGRGAMDALPAAFDPASFAAMDRIMAEMDARAAQMMGRMRDMQVRMAAAARAAETGDPGAMQWVSLPGFGPAAGPIAVTSLPPGAVSYSSVTRVSGGRSCTESVQVTRISADAAPQVVRRASGDCGNGMAAPSSAPAAAPIARTIAAPKPARPQAPPPRPRDVI
jgi:hypothetical protein